MFDQLKLLSCVNINKAVKESFYLYKWNIHVRQKKKLQIFNYP